MGKWLNPEEKKIKSLHTDAEKKSLNFYKHPGKIICIRRSFYIKYESNQNLSMLYL